MKCELCKKREATTHITKIVNGYKKELHLCSECAAQSNEYKDLNMGMNFGIGDFLTGIFNAGKHQGIPTREAETDICPTCHMPYSEFLKKGKVGCGDCYTAFKSRITRPIRQIHGTVEHIGKAPKRIGNTVMLDKKISELESALNAAVLKQDFENAAKLRDEIKALKNNNEKEA